VAEAEIYAEAHCRQPSLFAKEVAPSPKLDLAHTKLVGVRHLFAVKGQRN
jgi:hypothetical protein